MTGLIVETTAGKVEGYLADGVKVFKGIAYGSNTGGPGRFRPPIRPAPWAGVRQATGYGKASPQTVVEPRRGCV